MPDVKALGILSAQIENYRKVSEPPGTLDAVDKYCISIKQVMDAFIFHLVCRVTIEYF